MINKQDLINGFGKLGLERGDTVLVHSSYKSFGGVDGGPDEVINTLIKAAWPYGTLIMPTFTFDFCSGIPVNMNAPSKMGVLSEFVRSDRLQYSFRLWHPIYSFAIFGSHAPFLGELSYKSAFEENSLFGHLRKLNGKIMIIGLHYDDSMTFAHHIEQMEGVDYRFEKEFTGLVTDYAGDTTEQTASMLVRDRDRGVITSLGRMQQGLRKAGIAKVEMIGDAEVELMDANEVYEWTAAKMKKQPDFLYEIKEVA